MTLLMVLVPLLLTSIKLYLIRHIDHIIMSSNNPIPYETCQVFTTDPLNMSDNQAVSITIQLKQPSMNQIIEEEASDPTVPSFVWKNGDFIPEYSRNVDGHLSQLQNEGRAIGIDLMCKVLHESARSAFETCFPEKF
jgi:hypothetical protein